MFHGDGGEASTEEGSGFQGFRPRIRGASEQVPATLSGSVFDNWALSNEIRRTQRS